MEREEIVREHGSSVRQADGQLGRDIAIDLVGELDRKVQFLQIPQPEHAAHCHEAQHGGYDQEEEVVAGIYRSQAQHNRDDDIESACSVDLYDRGIWSVVNSSLNSPSRSMDSYPGRMRSR